MKYISLILIAILLVTGCQAKDVTPEKEKITVMTSLFPQYDFARQVGGDLVEVTLLLPPGVEAHAYEPTPKEIVAIQESDLFLYTGEHMEPWAHRLIEASDDIKPVDLSQAITLIEDDHDHEDHSDEGEAAEDDHDHDHEGVDPHIWTDPQNAMRMVGSIRDALIEIAPEHKAAFTDNAAAYLAKLEQLDQDFAALFEPHDEIDIFFAGHNAFGYFAKRYDLHFHSPYSGYSPDAEPSPRAISELMEKMKETDSKVVYYEELIEPKVAEVIRDATGAEMMLLNGAHNISKEDLTAGIGYLDIFRQNLEALRKGLE